MKTGAAALRESLLALGFDTVRFARIPENFSDDPNVAALRRWLAAGHHAGMAWLERGFEKRASPALALPGARTMIVLGVNYLPAFDRSGGFPADTTSNRTPLWARYAQYADYHDTIKPALEQAGRVLETQLGLAAADYRYYTDTGPVLERAWAARAGVGFFGKNAMLISKKFGNWLFLSAILVRAEIEPDEPLRGGKGRGGGGPDEPESGDWRAGWHGLPARDYGTHKQAGAPKPQTHGQDARATQSGDRRLQDESDSRARVGLLCGKCTRCIDACPTGAIVSAGTVDSRRCISYLTIENKGAIPRGLRAAIGSRIYGCDICAEVCPWNRFAQASRGVLLDARPEIATLPLREILGLTPERFSAVFRKTAIKRIKIAGLLRNACVVAGNLRDASCLDILARLAAHESPLVRAHAVWAVFEIAGRGRGEELLRDARAKESDADVLREHGL